LPEILRRSLRPTRGSRSPTGDDQWTQRLDAVLGGFFGAEVRAFAVATGTAANALSLATLAPPYGAIYGHEEAHIATDECGAPGFFCGGAQLMPLPGPAGKLTLEALRLALDAQPGFRTPPYNQRRCRSPRPPSSVPCTGRPRLPH